MARKWAYTMSLVISCTKLPWFILLEKMFPKLLPSEAEIAETIQAPAFIVEDDLGEKQLRTV